jgi:PEP-CTERM motif
VKCRLRGLAVVAVFSLASHASLALTTLTFNELPFQPVDDLTFQGVTFDFKVAGVDSADATYNTDGPGSITYVQDPSLEGTSSGILALDFATPTPVLQFGVALATIGTLTPGFTVELFDASLVPIGSFSVITQDLAGFTEGQFVYPGGSSVGRAVVSFDASAARFAFDNLKFFVPEPSSALLLAAGLAGLAVRGRARS